MRLLQLWFSKSRREEGMCAEICRPKIGFDFLIQVHRWCFPPFAVLIGTKCFLCLILGSPVWLNPQSQPWALRLQNEILSSRLHMDLLKKILHLTVGKVWYFIFGYSSRSSDCIRSCCFQRSDSDLFSKVLSDNWNAIWLI